MEATVTMSLRDYDLMNLRIRNLEDEAKTADDALNSLKIICQELATKNKKLSFSVMQYKGCVPGETIRTRPLDYCLQDDGFGRLNAIYYGDSPELYQLGIDIDTQKEYITKLWNEAHKEEQEDGSN